MDMNINARTHKALQKKCPKCVNENHLDGVWDTDNRPVIGPRN